MHLKNAINKHIKADSTSLVIGAPVCETNYIVCITEIFNITQHLATYDLSKNLNQIFLELLPRL